TPAGPPGQLEGEMRGGYWVSVPADQGLLFDDDHERKWERAMAKRRIELQTLGAGRSRRTVSRGRRYGLSVYCPAHSEATPAGVSPPLYVPPPVMPPHAPLPP